MIPSSNRIRHASIAIAISWLIVAPAPAWAQLFLHLNPSVRAAGMGEAGTAVFWGGDANDWSNPALLGYEPGVQYRWSHAQIAPEISTDIAYNTNRLNYGWGGIGVAWSDLKFTLGESEGTDELGNPTGTFEVFERARPLGLGVSVSRLVDALAVMHGGEAPAFLRYADVAFGFAHKGLRVELAPESRQGVATTSTNDYGFLARVSPLPGSEDTPSLDLSYGFAAMSYDDASFQFPNDDQPIPVSKEFRNGVALHFTVPAGAGLRESLSRAFGRWIGRGMTPLISVGVAADFVHIEETGFGPSDIDQAGVEVEILHVLSARVGHAHHSVDGADGTAYGFGVGLPIGGFSGICYDFASTPRPADLDPLRRHAVTAWFDPVAFARR